MMKDPDVFWRLEALSDRQLLERVGAMLGSSRRLMAELVAHLGEVEERRLHLAASCSSLFAYCLKLGMTEDEAYRRIEVARLARRYPAIFPLLAHGQLSISVVALLKHHLSDENHLELLAAATGKSVEQTRQLIAARFPRPDVASTIRKLPERRTTIQPSLALSGPAEPRSTTEPRRGETEHRITKPSSGTELRATEPRRDAAEPSPSLPAAPPPPSSRIEPLSARRYKVQLTASAELARKLQLAKDLMRHSHPGGELGPIVERAMDLLIESLMQRRFGKSKKASSKPTSESARRAAGTTPEHGLTTPERGAASQQHGAASQQHSAASQEGGVAEQETMTSHTTEHDASTMDSATPDAPMIDTADGQLDRRGELDRASSSSYLRRSTRRAIVERDGLDCSWVDEHGVRCGSRSWLEYDHRHPRAKGGGSEPNNLRLLCRNHNRFAAEREYGREHVARTIAERRRERAPHAPHAI